MTRVRVVAAAIPALLLVTVPRAFADSSPPTAASETSTPEVAPAAASPDQPGFNLFPTHRGLGRVFAACVDCGSTPSASTTCLILP
jgi:hypothetical protein